MYIGEEWIHLEAGGVEAGVEAPTGSVATLDILNMYMYVCVCIYI